MIRPLALSVLFMITTLLLSCKQPAEMSERERYEIASIVKREDEKRLFRREELTPDRFEYFREQILDTDDPAWLGPAVLLVYDTRLQLAKEGPELPYIAIEVSGIDVDEDIKRNFAVMSRECVVSTMKVRFRYINKEGDKAPYVLFQHSTVWVKRDKEWKVLFNHAAIVKNYGIHF